MLTLLLLLNLQSMSGELWQVLVYGGIHALDSPAIGAGVIGLVLCHCVM